VETELEHLPQTLGFTSAEEALASEVRCAERASRRSAPVADAPPNLMAVPGAGAGEVWIFPDPARLILRKQRRRAPASGLRRHDAFYYRPS